MDLSGCAARRAARGACRTIVVAIVFAALAPATGMAATRCKAKVDPKDRTINVGAKTVVGTLKWGSLNFASDDDGSSCWESIDTFNLIPVATLDVSSYVPPFQAVYEP